MSSMEPTSAPEPQEKKRYPNLEKARIARQEQLKKRVTETKKTIMKEDPVLSLKPTPQKPPEIPIDSVEESMEEDDDEPPKTYHVPQKKRRKPLLIDEESEEDEMPKKKKKLNESEEQQLQTFGGTLLQAAGSISSAISTNFVPFVLRWSFPFVILLAKHIKDSRRVPTTTPTPQIDNGGNNTLTTVDPSNTPPIQTVSVPMRMNPAFPLGGGLSDVRG